MVVGGDEDSIFVKDFFGLEEFSGSPFEIVLVAFVALIIQHPCFVVALVFHSVTTVIEFERAELIK